jgi:GTP-dependent phosphoenolpyruvate carboxykinase
VSATHISFLGLFLFAIAVVTYWMTKGIDQAIIDGAVQTCVGYIKPQGDVENTVIETKGDSTLATFQIRIKDSKESLICTVDWFSYIAHGDYVVLWVKPES